MIVLDREWLWLCLTSKIHVNQLARRSPEFLPSFDWLDRVLGLSVELLAGLKMRDDIVIVEKTSGGFFL